MLNAEHIQNCGSKEVSRFNTGLAHTNEEISVNNYDMLIKLGNLIIKIKATHSASTASHLPSDEFGGLGPIVSFNVVQKLCYLGIYGLNIIYVMVQ